MDKFVERAKEQIFYESEGGNDDVRLMLSRSEANSRTNIDMGRFSLAVLGITDCWNGAWQNMFGDLGEALELKLLNLNGYSRLQAIEMAGQHTVTQGEVLEKKEGGYLAYFQARNNLHVVCRSAAAPQHVGFEVSIL